MTRVLLVDDEEILRLSLTYALQKEGFEVTTAADGVAGLERALAEAPDVVVLDVMLPGLDGVEVCRRVRAVSGVPIVMLSARDDTADKLKAFKTGADDYVTKPFQTRELIARLRAVVRRRTEARTTGHAAGVIHSDGVTISLDGREVTADGRPVVVGPVESAILRVLMLNAGHVVTRTDLAVGVWGYYSPEKRDLLDAGIRALRGCLERDASRPTRIRTVPGIGFQFGAPT